VRGGEGVKFAGSKEEAEFLMRLYKSYSSAQDVVFHLQNVLEPFGLVDKNGKVQIDKVIAVEKALHDA